MLCKACLHPETKLNRRISITLRTISLVRNKGVTDSPELIIIAEEELKAVTSVPPPDPSHWVFVPENDFLFAKEKNLERTAPNTWVERGPEEIFRALSM